MKTQLSVTSLMDAQIPRLFWDLSFATFPQESLKVKEELGSYFHNFDEALSAGVGLTITGPAFSGKTFLACELAKGLLATDHSVRYFTVSDLNSAVYSSSVPGLLKHDDLIILDDVSSEEGESTPEWQVSLVRRSVSFRHSINRPMVLVTRHTSEEFMHIYGSAVVRSLLNDSLVVSCKAFSEKTQNRIRQDKLRKGGFKHVG